MTASIQDIEIPEVIRKLNFGYLSYLGPHWLDPKRTDLTDDELSERPKCYERLAKFISDNNYTPFSYNYSSIVRLFDKGGKSEERVDSVLEKYFGASDARGDDTPRDDNRIMMHDYGLGCPFNYGEIWGKDGVPICMVGHPHIITDYGFETLHAIRKLGMHLHISDYTWHGFGTINVVVSNLFLSR